MNDIKKFLFIYFVSMGLAVGSPVVMDPASPQHLDYVESPQLKAELILKNQGVIWGMTFLDENSLVFTERSGGLNYFEISKNSVRKLSHDLSVAAVGQGGLLDIAKHPDFKNNKYLYTCYATKKGDGYITQLSRMKWLKGNVSKSEVLFSMQPTVDEDNHFGCRITFDDQGYLFLSIGERTQRHQAQKLNNHQGKVLRLTADGKAPLDNPFIGTKGALPEIWSYGHRNPQGLYWDSHRKILWEQEHGPRGGDEINIIVKGGNYGWPVITYGREYWGPKVGKGTHQKGMIQPFYYYTPSIATCGLLVYSGKKYTEWKGDLFSGALAKEHLNHLHIKNGKTIRETRYYLELDERVRNVKESPAGAIYFSTDQGNIYRIKK